MARALHSALPVTATHTRGFTLIEMMIVVAIVGILATLAVVGYRKLVLTSHVTEATNTVQGIRVAQEGYHAETQQYADISANLTSAWYPRATPDGQHATAWGAACPSSACPTLDWSVLPLHLDGPVMFGYATRSGPANSAPEPLPSDMSTVALPATLATDWYMVVATCDIDGLGSPDTYVLTTSWTNQVFTFNEGR